MDGLLLSGGSDISPEFVRQEIRRSLAVLDRRIDPERDRWEVQAVQDALSRGLPILAICKGLQVFNVALGGTLKLDIRGHNLPDQKHRDVQLLRSARGASHRFPKVNSAHHQAIDKLGDDLEAEAWAAHDGDHRASAPLPQIPVRTRCPISPGAQSNLRFVIRQLLRAIGAGEAVGKFRGDCHSERSEESLISLFGIAGLQSEMCRFAQYDKRRVPFNHSTRH